MSAVAVSIVFNAARQSRLTLTERRELNRLLNRWGNWVEKHWDFDGYPSTNILESYIGSDLGAPGHRILCLEMPTDVYATHQRVIRLPEDERAAIWLWYVPVTKENGTIRSIAERCEIAGITEENLRKRVSRGRQRIAGISPQ
jgi:hypothetical protein